MVVNTQLTSTMGTGGPFPGGKARPRRDANHSSVSRAEAENECEQYLLSLQAPSWRVVGQLLMIDSYYGGPGLVQCMWTSSNV
jgi:hypothetical protein